jgi:hypothetical protein
VDQKLANILQRDFHISVVLSFADPQNYRADIRSEIYSETQSKGKSVQLDLHVRNRKPVVDHPLLHRVDPVVTKSRQ